MPVDAASPPDMIASMVPGMRLMAFGEWFGMVTGIPGELMGEGLMAMGFNEEMMNDFTMGDMMQYLENYDLEGYKRMLYDKFGGKDRGPSEEDMEKLKIWFGALEGF